MPQPHHKFPSISTRKPSGVPLRPGIDQQLAVGDFVARWRHIIAENDARLAARFHDVELLLVGREGEPVGRIDAVGHHGHRAAFAVDAIDIHRQFRLGDAALVVAEDAETRIGEPDRAVRFHHDIVRRIEPLALEAVADHRDGPVIFGAGDAAREMLAGHQPALAVAGIAVGVVRRLAEKTDGAGLLVPAADAIARHVAP